MTEVIIEARNAQLAEICTIYAMYLINYITCQSIEYLNLISLLLDKLHRIFLHRM